MSLKESFKEYNDLRVKQKGETGVSFILNNDKGKPTFSSMKIWRQQDGFIYINKDVDVLYELVDFIWQGAQYKTISKSKTNTKSKGKTKRKGRLTGAAVGALINPTGAVIGAMVGTGNKRKKGNSNSTTTAEEVEKEIDTPATIKLKKTSTDEIKIINFQCNSAIANLLNTFIPEKTKETDNVKPHRTGDIYSEIKNFKELLDADIITQEEFDQKKKELLNI